MTMLVSIAAAASLTFAPLLHTADPWINGRVTEQTLAGRVVVVEVFTFDCVNCKHVVPELRALRRSEPSSEVAILGIHSPETAYERDRSNVAQNLARQGITWPVALDNDFALWHAFGIEYWPTQLIFDRQGRLRKTIIGEGQDALVESAVRELVAER